MKMRFKRFLSGFMAVATLASVIVQPVTISASELEPEPTSFEAEVVVTKQDKDTENPLDGGIFGLYAASDITNADGTVVVKKGTLIEKVTTGNDGTAKFTADLPLGFYYDVKEVQAPEGYLRNADDVYTFAFSYTNDKEAKLTFKHTFKNERVTAKISLQKQDKETKKAVPQGDATLEKAVYGLYKNELLVGITGAVAVKLMVYMKGKNAKKFRQGVEYGSARWGTAKDIAPFIAPVFENNILLTMTERLTMNGRPKNPKFARNKNVIVIGGSGSGKTRFYVKPNLMQMGKYISYVVTDPKGTIIIECGKMLVRHGYKVKVLNTINFSKSHAL